jgi:hypothetical protein
MEIPAHAFPHPKRYYLASINAPHRSQEVKYHAKARQSFPLQSGFRIELCDFQSTQMGLSLELEYEVENEDEAAIRQALPSLDLAGFFPGPILSCLRTGAGRAERTQAN